MRARLLFMVEHGFISDQWPVVRKPLNHASCKPEVLACDLLLYRRTRAARGSSFQQAECVLEEP